MNVMMFARASRIKVALALTAMVLMTSAGWAARIFDEFGDGNLGSNTDGTGAGWTVMASASASSSEASGVAALSVGKEHGSTWIQGKDADEFSLWNSTTTTVTWIIKEMTIQSSHPTGGTVYDWDLAVLSAKASNSGWNHIGGCTAGAFYIRLGMRPGTANSYMNVYISNKNNTGVESNPAGKADLGVIYGWGYFPAVYPIVVTAKLSKDGWAVTMNQSLTGSAKLSGNWTTTPTTAPISDEFSTGAFVGVFGRVAGLGGTGSSTFTPNIGKVESVKVEQGTALPAVAGPTFTPPAGTFSSAQTVTLNSATDGATIRYTINGTTPTATNGISYSSLSPISIASTTLLKAYAYKTGMDESGVSNGLYTILGGPLPTSVVNGGFESDTAGWTVSSSDANPAKYGIHTDEGTRDGVAALAMGAGGAGFAGNAVFEQMLGTVAGTAYTLTFEYGAYGAAALQQMRVDALDGGTVSIANQVVTATGPGSYTASSTTFQTRTLTFTAVSSVTSIRFTDQTTSANGTSTDGILDAVVLSGGGGGVSTVAMPSFSPPAGTFSNAQSVTLITTTDGASINYTINGIDPTTNSGTLYSGAIPVAATTTIKAIAYKPGMNPSTVNSATYTIQTGPVTNALLNGSFENGTTGWAVSSSDANPAKYAVGGGEGRNDGTNALILGNDNAFAGNTVLEQTLATVVGAAYTVVFDYAAYGNPNKQQALRSEAVAGATVLSTVDVTASLTSANFNPASVVFRTYTNVFTATAASTTIRFKDVTTLANGDSCDGILDNVRVSGPPSGGTVTVKGTPVTWLENHGLTGDPDVRDMEDSDGDGLKAWEEYVAGTDPTVRGNCFTATLAWVSGKPVLSFNGLLASGTDYPSHDRYYEVQKSTSLGGGVWVTVPGYTAILGAGGGVSYTNPTPSQIEIYRVRARLQAK